MLTNAPTFELGLMVGKNFSLEWGSPRSEDSKKPLTNTITTTRYQGLPPEGVMLFFLFLIGLQYFVTCVRNVCFGGQLGITSVRRPPVVTPWIRKIQTFGARSAPSADGWRPKAAFGVHRRQTPYARSRCIAQNTRTQPTIDSQKIRPKVHGPSTRHSHLSHEYCLNFRRTQLLCVPLESSNF